MTLGRNLILLAAATLALSACAGSDRGLRTFAPGPGPDEFQVQPQLPLTLPDNLSALPRPTPGGTNLTDPTPVATAIATLGGRPGAVVAGGIPAGDAALVAAAGRNGVSPDIRAELAAADAALRSRRARIGLFGGRGEDRYFQAYANQALNAYAELERFRAAGVQVPTAPPVE